MGDERKIWSQAVKAAVKEPCPPMQGHKLRFSGAVNELTDDRTAIRSALREARLNRGVRVRIKYP